MIRFLSVAAVNVEKVGGRGIIMLPNVLSPSPIYHSSVFKNVGDPQNTTSSVVGAYFMENLLRANSVVNEQSLQHLLPTSATTSVFKSSGEVELATTMSSNSLKDKARNNAMLFLGHSAMLPSSSPGSGMRKFGRFLSSKNASSQSFYEAWTFVLLSWSLI